MSDTVDARGLSCPQPVILARNGINKGAFPFKVLVDTTTSCENIKRMAEKNGCNATVEEQGDEYKVTISKV